MHHTEAGGDFHYLVRVLVAVPGVDHDINAVCGHGTAELPDVDIHAAGITRTGLLQRAGVEGKVGDAADHDCLPVTAETAYRGRGVAPRRNLYASPPLRKSNTLILRSIALSIRWESMTLPGE